MDYRFEQKGRRFSVLLAAVASLAMSAIGLAYAAPWYFTALALVTASMPLAVLVRNGRNGMTLEGDDLTVFRNRWRHRIDARTIRHVRIAAWTDGKPDVLLELDRAPDYRLPSDCFGSLRALETAFRSRGIPVG